jgi:hypothetical protein
MRYRVVATSLRDRRCLLAVGDDGDHYLLTFSGLWLRPVKVDNEQARKLEYGRGWVPAHDHTPRTIFDLSAQLPFA